MDLINRNRIIRLADCHAGYSREVAEHFDMFFEAVVPDKEDGHLVADYSRPRVHQYGDLGEFEFTSLPEEPGVLEGYFQHYKPKPTDVVFDVGAYCGATTVTFAKKTKHVFAFEPDRTNREVLLRNLERHRIKNVTVIPCALAGQNGYEFFNCESTPGSALPRTNGRASFTGTEVVETITLASACEKCGMPDFIKLDIEGAEVEVLESSRDLLMGAKIPLVVDTNHHLPPEYYPDPTTPKNPWTKGKVEELLRSYGYEMIESSQEWGGYWMTWAVARLKVLVVIPVHNRLQFLGEAIRSVELQTRKADQVTVTGNVGPGIITEAPIAIRVNEVIESSDCDAFILLCDDDAIAPTYIEKTAELMAKTGADIVYADTEFFGNLRLPHYGQEKTKPWSDEIDKHNIVSLFSLCRKSMWRKVGGWADVPLFDWDFWWRCYHAGATTAYVPEPLSRYRVHHGQETYHMNINAAYGKAVERHRQLLKDRSWIRK